MKIFEWLFFWWFPVIGRELQCPLGTITLHLSLPQARWYVGSWLCSRLLSWAHDLVLNQSVHHSPSWPQWWVQGWACDIMRSNPGIFAVASQRASSFSCPESKLSVLPLWKKILNNHAAKAGERRAKRCKEKALTSLSEPPSPALFALDLPVSCFPCGSAGKESAYNVGDLGSVPRLGRSSGEENGYPLQYSCLGNPTDRGDWQATVHRVAKESDTTEWINNNRLRFQRVKEKEVLVEEGFCLICTVNYLRQWHSNSPEIQLGNMTAVAV